MATTRTLVAVLSLLAIGSSESAQPYERPTIADVAQKHDRTTGPLYLVRVVETIPQSRDRMARRADLILEGTVKNSRSYLSESGRWIDTDYEIEPTQVVVDRKPRVPARSVGPNPLLVRASGGRLMVDGVEVIAQESQFGLLPSGVPLVLFLTYDAPTDRYHILDGAGGFTLRSGSYAPMLKQSGDEPIERGKFLHDLDGEIRAPSVP